MISPYKRPNFAFVVSRLQPDQIATALETAFDLGLLAACERMEDAALEQEIENEDSCAIREAMEVDVPDLDEALKNLFLLGETL